jgi:hypothetical protein
MSGAPGMRHRDVIGLGCNTDGSMQEQRWAFYLAMPALAMLYGPLVS